jgi:hypothetical protein
VFDVVNALRYMHSRMPAVVHGDLKSSNVIVEELAVRPSGTDATDDDAAFCAKLLDFGLSRLLTRSAQPLGGTKRWMAPELLSHQRKTVRPDAASDVYSMGQLMYFITTRELPFHSRRMEDVMGWLKRGSVPDLDWPASSDSRSLPQRCRAVVEWCTHPKPSARPSSEQVSTELSRVLEWDPAHVASKRNVEGARRGGHGRQVASPPHRASPRAVPDTLARGLRQDGLDPPTAGATAGSGGYKRSGRCSSTRVDTRTPDDTLPPVLEDVVLERAGASVTVWFNVVSAQWSILQATGCTEIFWGRVSQSTELGGLFRWIHPDARESLIFWVQTNFQQLDAERGAEPCWRSYAEAVLFRPPLLRTSSACMSASVAMMLSTEQDRCMVQMNFDDIRMTNASPRT